MITVLPSSERFHTEAGWLDSHHSFSFADHYDPERLGFRALRVINDDRVQPARGFGSHSHRDMEIITYVLSGELAHKDSMGNGSIIRPGEVQRMSAGTGVVHSEMNPSRTEPVHFLQIWVVPDRSGHEPGYEQKLFPDAERRGKLRVVASPDGRDGSVTIHQDALVHASLLERGERVSYSLPSTRHAWVHVARGTVDVNGQSLREGDGAAISDEDRLDLTARESSEVLLFDLA
ncbi:MAG: pirin family protein [Chloroflexi bacterium]|nr:MAG: pirin family protein [Chloroflexota bacterium]